MADESIRVPIDGDTSGFDQKVEGMKGTISAASVAMGNLLSDMGKKALSAFGDMISSGDEFNKAINQMSSSTGATGAELEGLRDVVKDVYGNNFGDSYEDAANAVAEVTKQTGLMGEELQSATEGAMALSDTFGYEVNESTRAASALMNNFGISAEEAYNLIAPGAQNGADQNGDLLDTLNEYSTQYAALGLSAEQFTQSLISGAESGAFSIDKVGDAVKSGQGLRRHLHLDQGGDILPLDPVPVDHSLVSQDHALLFQPAQLILCLCLGHAGLCCQLCGRLCAVLFQKLQKCVHVTGTSLSEIFDCGVRRPVLPVRNEYRIYYISFTAQAQCCLLDPPKIHQDPLRP